MGSRGAPVKRRTGTLTVGRHTPRSISRLRTETSHHRLHHDHLHALSVAPAVRMRHPAGASRPSSPRLSPPSLLLLPRGTCFKMVGGGFWNKPCSGEPACPAAWLTAYLGDWAGLQGGRDPLKTEVPPPSQLQLQAGGVVFCLKICCEVKESTVSS